jgi:hypothetical protein
MRKSGQTVARVDALTKEEWDVLQGKLNRPVTIMPFQKVGLQGRNGISRTRQDYNGEFSSSY